MSVCWWVCVDNCSLRSPCPGGSCVWCVEAECVCLTVPPPGQSCCHAAPQLVSTGAPGCCLVVTCVSSPSSSPTLSWAEIRSSDFHQKDKQTNRKFLGLPSWPSYHNCNLCLALAAWLLSPLISTSYFPPDQQIFVANKSWITEIAVSIKCRAEILSRGVTSPASEWWRAINVELLTQSNLPAVLTQLLQSLQSGPFHRNFLSRVLPIFFCKELKCPYIKFNYIISSSQLGKSSLQIIQSILILFVPPHKNPFKRRLFF